MGRTHTQRKWNACVAARRGLRREGGADCGEAAVVLCEAGEEERGMALGCWLLQRYVKDGRPSSTRRGGPRHASKRDELRS